jgi:polynucleotide 5'-kinase involved in rRNA processing
METRKRISFLGSKRFRKISESNYRPYPAEVVTLASNDSEMLVLFKNNCSFAFKGQGTLTLIHGYVRIMGYEIRSATNKSDYSFDIRSQFDIYSSESIGVRIDNNDNNVAQQCEKLVRSISKNNLLNTSQYFNFNDNISVLYFSHLENFELIKDISDDSHIIDFSKYEKNVDNTALDNKLFSISGKKNSGKSTFLIYLLNKLLSHIRETGKPSKLFLLDCDSQPLLSQPLCISLIKIDFPILFNYYKENIRGIEVVRSLYVDDIGQLSSLDDYLDAFISVHRDYSCLDRNNRLVINTNGNTNGFGGLINTALIEIVKPQVNFYIKNLKKGRFEKGEEFENYITKDVEIKGLDIVIRKYKQIHLEENNLKLHLDLDSTCITINNNFDLKDVHNTHRKQKIKSIYTLVNLFGQYTNGLSFYDILYNHKLFLIDLGQYLVKIPMDQINFCINFDLHNDAINDLDVLMAINDKLCVVLDTSANEGSFGKNCSLRLIDYDNNQNNKNFICLCYVYNIDIMERNLILLSSKVKKLGLTKFTLLRNSQLDKTLDSDKERRFENFILANTNNANEDETLYYTRNKYTINC